MLVGTQLDLRPCDPSRSRLRPFPAVPTKRALSPVSWPTSSQFMSTFGREGFSARCHGTSRGSNPYALGRPRHHRPDLAYQEKEMADEWWRGWDEAHLDH